MDAKDPYSHLPDELHPFKNFKPRQNALKNELDSNTKQFPPIDVADHAALRNLAKERLIEIIQHSPANTSLVPAIRELLDRIDGKAPQSIALDVKDTRMDRMPIERLLKLAAMLDEPVVLLPPIKD